MRRNRIQEEWSALRAKVIPSGVDRDTLLACRISFYAGCHAVLCRIAKDAENRIYPTDRDMRMMDDIQAELREFFERLDSGIA